SDLRKPLIVGGGDMTVKAAADFPVPPVEVVTEIGPEDAAAGTLVSTRRSVTKVNVALTPLKATPVTPVKLAPFTVTAVPATPLTGVKLDTTGATPVVTVKLEPLAALPPALTTLIGPVVAPTGTVEMMVLSS